MNRDEAKTLSGFLNSNTEEDWIEYDLLEN